MYRPIAFILSVNLQRRHLTTGQRAMLAVELLPYLEAQAKERWGNQHSGEVGGEFTTEQRKSRDQAAEAGTPVPDSAQGRTVDPRVNSPEGRKSAETRR